MILLNAWLYEENDHMIHNTNFTTKTHHLFNLHSSIRSWNFIATSPSKVHNTNTKITFTQEEDACFSSVAGHLGKQQQQTKIHYRA